MYYCAIKKVLVGIDKLTPTQMFEYPITKFLVVFKGVPERKKKNFYSS